MGRWLGQDSPLYGFAKGKAQIYGREPNVKLILSTEYWLDQVPRVCKMGFERN